ncbi:hypothetical protein HZI30_07055 [Serratia fonticola]|uniref:hypothetical protein n=1 Tax=Serratia fonticola TaxID=47917 RepID=UPI0015C59590|nr:hypothetical protein [Serratia fonticola]NXZ86689.1 hypothetical protein [Serratia fonticola]
MKVTSAMHNTIYDVRTLDFVTNGVENLSTNLSTLNHENDKRNFNISVFIQQVEVYKYFSRHEIVIGNDRKDYYAFTEKLIPMKVESLFESQKEELIIDACIEFDSLSARVGKIYLSDSLTNKDKKTTENIFYNFYFFCMAGLTLNYYEEVIRKDSYVYGLAHQGEVLLMS